MPMLRLAISCLAIFALPLFASAAERPNVLWIFCEDLSPWMSSYGDTTVETPHLDAMARRGVVFRGCYATAPVCSPSRSAVATGVMQTTLGLHQHRSSRTEADAIRLPEHVKTVPELFRQAGYFTYNHGKDDYNFVHRWEDLHTDGHKPKSYGFYGSHGYGDWTERSSDQPFFGQIMLLGGKNKRKIDAPTDPASIRVPPYYPDNDVFRRELARHYDQIRLTDAEVGRLVARMKADGVYENTILFFFSDHGGGLARGKLLCYEEGLHVPLLIAWPAGAKTVRPGTVRKDLCSLIDVAATSLALAGLDVPRWMDSRNLFDRSYRREFVVAARDRADWTIDRIRMVRTPRWKYLRNFLTDRPRLQQDYRSGQEAFRLYRQLHAEGRLTPAQASLLESPRAAEELYDLENDPHELRNLADDPRHAEKLAEMRATLDRWIRETDDQGRYPEPDAALRVLLKRWGKRCVDPVFDRAREGEE